MPIRVLRWRRLDQASSELNAAKSVMEKIVWESGVISFVPFQCHLNVIAPVSITGFGPGKVLAD